jgi:ribonucleoside-diphosphate reductase alpha chain
MISKTMFDRSLAESQLMATERGEPEHMIGSGLRNANRLAYAPNANSSIIAQTSASIEPISANIYTHRTRVGSHVIKNKYLDEIIKARDCNYDEVWSSITANAGSIQHLSELFSEDELRRFKTANEIDMRYVVDQARIRQEFIDQASSLNLFFVEGVSKKVLNDVHRRAFSNDPKLPGVPLKTLYYLRSTKAAQVENVSGKLKRDALKDYESQATASEDECISCQA